MGSGQMGRLFASKKMGHHPLWNLIPAQSCEAWGCEQWGICPSYFALVVKEIMISLSDRRSLLNTLVDYLGLPLALLCFTVILKGINDETNAPK